MGPLPACICTTGTTQLKAFLTLMTCWEFEVFKVFSNRMVPAAQHRKKLPKNVHEKKNLDSFKHENSYCSQ